MFRDKRATEKSVVGADGKELKGMEQIRAGLQELGPRTTLKLRRVDRGIGRADNGVVPDTDADAEEKAEEGGQQEEKGKKKKKKDAGKKQGKEDANVEWEWKAKMEKVRTRFNL